MSDDRQAFDEFVEGLRREVFDIYEAVREAQRDGSVSDRCAALGRAAVGAEQVYVAIAALNAAVYANSVEESNGRVLVSV